MPKVERRTVITEYRAVATGLTKSLRSIETSSASAAKRLEKMDERVRKFGTALKGFVSAAAVTGAFRGLTRFSDFSDSILELSQRTGVATDAIQALRAQTQLYGGTIDESDRALEFFNKRLGQARIKGGETAEVFERFGIDINAGINESLDQLVRKLQSIQDPSNLAALAVESFGRSGLKAAQAAQNMTGSLKETAGYLGAQGKIIDEDTLRKAAEFGDTMAELRQIMAALAAGPLAAVTQKIGDLGKAFLNSQKYGDSFLDQLADIYAIRDLQDVGVSEASARVAVAQQKRITLLQEERELREKIRSLQEDLGPLDTMFHFGGSDAEQIAEAEERLRGIANQLREIDAILQRPKAAGARPAFDLDIGLDDYVKSEELTAQQFIQRIEGLGRNLSAAQEQFLQQYWANLVNLAKQYSNVSLPELLAILDIESALGTNLAKNASSSARGVGQFIDSTAAEVGARLGLTVDQIQKEIGPGLLAIADYFSELKARSDSAYDAFSKYSDVSGLEKFNDTLSLMQRAAGDAVGANETLAESMQRTAEAQERESQTAYDALVIRNQITAYIQSQRDAYDSLVDSLDPVIAAQRRYAESVQLVIQAQTLLGLSAKEVDATLEKLYQRFQDDLDGISESGQNMQDVMQQLGATFSSAFEDAILDGGSFSDILRGLEQDLVRIITRMLVLKPLIEYLFGTGTTPGALSGVFGSVFGGARAFGGPVQRGQTYLVGERGPELFQPNQSGQILPAGATNNINISISGLSGGNSAADRRTANQLASAIGVRVQRAMGRLL